jgi:ABC-type transport system involved in multi-copper enzyme maturation permease subunit
MIPNRFKIIYDVTRKELLEHFKTLRLLVISVVFIIVFFIFMVGGHYLGGGAEPWYKIHPNDALANLLGVSSLFPPILAIALGYDTIVGERTRRSLHLIVSKPVDRSSIYIGKFLGAFISIAIIYLVVGSIGYLVVMSASGKIPNATEFGRAYGGIGVILFSAACWVLIVMLFSTSFKTVTSTVVFSVIFWLFILNILSQVGLIYYLFSQERDEEPITIDISTQATFGEINNTVLTFTAHRYESYVLDVEFDVRNVNGTKVQPFKTPGASLTSLIPTYIIPPGDYYWTAEYQETGKDSAEIIYSGSLRIDPEFIPITSVAPSLITPDNEEFNDFSLYIGTVEEEYNASYDILVFSSETSEIIDENNDYPYSTYYLQDLDEGDYRIEVNKGNTTYFNTTIHSYGTSEPEGPRFGFFIDEEIDYPTYVKVSAGINPDQAASVYGEVLTGESSAGVVLSVGEALIALSIIFILIFSLGLIIFSRIELL